MLVGGVMAAMSTFCTHQRMACVQARHASRNKRIQITNTVPNNVDEIWREIQQGVNLRSSGEEGPVEGLSGETEPYLNFHGCRPCFGWRRESAQPLEDEPKMQLSMKAETGDSHDARQPDDFGKTLTATQEGKLFSLLFSQAAAWLKAKWVTLLDTPNQPTALIFHTDGSCVSKQHAAKDKRRRAVLLQRRDPSVLPFPDSTPRCSLNRIN